VGLFGHLKCLNDCAKTRRIERYEDRLNINERPRDSPALTRYYEHDGMPSRLCQPAMFLALLFGVIAIGSLDSPSNVRVHPPTIIRVDKDGEATVEEQEAE